MFIRGVLAVYAAVEARGAFTSTTRRLGRVAAYRCDLLPKHRTFISFLAIILFLVFVGSALAQEGVYQGMEGTETPVFHQSTQTTECSVFNKYVVKTNQPAGEGVDISVYQRTSSSDPKTACRVKGKRYLFIKDSDNNSFFGIAGKFLFVDSGTSVESRGIEVYDLESRRSIITEGYTDNIKLVGGRSMIYEFPSDKKGPIRTCRDAAKWKREGGGPIGWVQSMKLDLHTLTKTKVGALRCIQMQ